MNDALRDQVLKAAYGLFMAHGYEAIGMRDIAKAVDRQPVQVYRLNLSKSDILAELIIALNQEQIALLPRLVKQVKGASAFERTCSFLKQLYKLDIQHQPIRAVGAAYGWMWSLEYERQVFEQIGQLVQPVVGWMQEDGLGEVQARIIGIWSLYYVGYRQAVIHGGSAGDCLKAIKPSLRLLFRGGHEE